jgi:histidinol-phosphate/aromatic aminotransferase/cobyric acid decarboxylase-like protein
MKTIQVVVIHGDERTTRFMQDADVFEKFKVIAKAQKYELDLADDYPPASAMESLKKAITEAGHRVVAIFQPNLPEGAWRDETVKVISDGTQWGMLDDLLEAYYYKGEQKCTV